MIDDFDYWEWMNNRIEEKINKPMEEEIQKRVIDEFIPHMELMDFVITTTEIRCDGCNTIAKSYMDEWEAIDEFLDKGWGVLKDKCYCEKCANKLAKNKK